MNVENPSVSIEWLSAIDEKDAADIVSLINSTATDQDGGTLGYANPMDGGESLHYIESLKHIMALESAYPLLGKVGGEAAFFCVMTRSPMQTGHHRAELSKGVVAPRFRGRRLVELAFREIIGKAESLGIALFVLDVREGTRAHALWSSFGFQTFGMLEDYARMGGESYRGCYMAQTVAQLKSLLS